MIRSLPSLPTRLPRRKTPKSLIVAVLLIVGFGIGIGMNQMSWNSEYEHLGVVNGKEVYGSDLRDYFSMTKEKFSSLSGFEKEVLFRIATEDYILQHEASRTKQAVNDLINFFDKVNPKKVEDEERVRNPGKSDEAIRDERLKRAKYKYREELQKRSTVRSFIDQTSDFPTGPKD